MTAPTFSSLSEAAAWYATWLAEAALPLWATAGADLQSGAWREALTTHGEPVAAPRRARVQARQVFAYASCARAGFDRGWRDVALRGFEFYRTHFRRSDGQFARLVDEAGLVIDETPFVYEQAFSLFAMAALEAGRNERGGYSNEAGRLLAALDGRRHARGGFREFGDHPFQSNAHMHLLEAAVAWEELGASTEWSGLADELVELCLSRFIDPEGGFLREFFDETWTPAGGDDGRWVEPGHQFEWAWLLERWGKGRNRADARAAARTLFERGLAGVDRDRGVATNRLWDDLKVRDATARLWPQTEYLKAALILGEEAEALAAANALARYLDVPARGAWRDKMLVDGSFVEEPAPASSFYHIVVAILELMNHARS